ncbi:MAG: FAD-dependent monooxygenase [Planctomycetota bacterium]|nr:MAG: FAD-dependent monooxygenase [Planctomycetota bacterium]
MPEAAPTVVVGAGPVGCVLASLLARRGEEVVVYEKRPDMRRESISAGRSINLVLTRRGLRALELLGLERQVLALTVPVLGRRIHPPGGGEARFQPYGKDERECNYSVSRGELNMRLLDEAEARGVRIRFREELVDADFDAMRLRFRGPEGEHEVEAARVYGCGGAPCAVRAALCRRPGYEDSLTPLEHGYKELTFPPAAGGGFAMDGGALHIWPRGDHFLMGLPNRDGSFTGTLYLRREGEPSFASLSDGARVRSFFEEHYADAIPLLADLSEFLANPTGTLGTVRCNRWNLEDRVLLVGDAAHAIVPFFGQGLNCGFEDCAVLARLLDEHGDDLAEAFAAFVRERKPNADAIADMALENFVEMRERVADPEWVKRKAIETILDRRLSHKYRSRYAMVMYSSIPYRDCFDAGLVQQTILAELAEGLEDPERVDLARAEALIDERLAPLLAERGARLDF